MFLLFSKPDPRLSSETSVDPMGLQVIWTHYARAVFEDKVSTLITDARVLTINLFHAYLLQELQENNLLAGATERFRDWKTDRDVRFGLLMLLEDLFIYIFFEQSEKGAADIAGLPGMMKANQMYRANNPIILRAEQKAGILTRQIQLGMMGRNKGGMVSMGLFNGDLLLNPDMRTKIRELFEGIPAAVELRDGLVSFIRSQVLHSSSKQHPVVDFDELRKTPLFRKVREGYLETFGKRKLPRPIREFWLDRLGFRSGAPNAIYVSVGALSTDKTEMEPDPAAVIREAHRMLAQEPGEKEKLDKILRIEPFLSLSDYVFRFIARRDVRRIIDHETELNRLREQLETDGHEDRLPLTDAHPRLRKLRSVMIGQGLSTIDWLSDIVTYHKQVMAERKNSPWLELQPAGTIKHLQTTSLPESIDSVKKFLSKRPWFHRYYVDSVRSLRELLS